MGEKQQTIVGDLAAFRQLSTGVTRLSFDAFDWNVADVKIPTIGVLLTIPGSDPPTELSIERARCCEIIRRYLRWDHQTPAFSWHEFEAALKEIANP